MSLSRNEIFQKLKPHCVDLSQCILRYESKRASATDVTGQLGSLLNVLRDVTVGNEFDQKLADYVFFPISHILRQSQQLPARALELALQCLDVLLRSGWRQNVPQDLARQLLILLSYLVSQSESGPGPVQKPEELIAVALRCLAALFEALSRSKSGRDFLIETTNVPLLGHAITVTLDGITDGVSVEIRSLSLDCLSAIRSCVKDREALASFFPGIVSALTKFLHARDRSTHPYRLLVKAIVQLSDLLLDVLNDDLLVKGVKRASTSASTNDNENDEKNAPLGPAWLDATAGQVKLALANVIGLRYHERFEVRSALADLCATVLQRCGQSLSSSAQMVNETLVAIAAVDGINDNSHAMSCLKMISANDSKILDLTKTSLHGWMVSMPRVMQGADDTAQRRLINQISASFRLLTESNAVSDITDSTLTGALQDTVSTAILASSKEKTMQVVESNGTTSFDLVRSQGGTPTSSFQPVLMDHKSQQGFVSELEGLLSGLAKSGSGAAISQKFLLILQRSTGTDQLSCFWLALHLLRENDEDNMFTDFLNLSVSSGERADMIDELYTFSLQKLMSISGTEDEDWREHALALEAVALQSQQLKEEFRGELVDALYPVVHLLATPNPKLQEHAIVCLNILLQTCGYNSVSDLILENVDYLVNAVALKLNTFDISPQAPQVLLMMIKLSGPSILPFLDDLIGSVFAALELYHGYPKLVELLFATLAAVVDEGSKSQQLAITGPGMDHKKQPYQPTSIQDLASMLEKSRLRASAPLEAEPSGEPTSFPEQPWGPEKKKDEDEDPLEALEEVAEADANAETLSKAPPPSKVYTILQNIARLSQHHLTSQSAPLRRELLRLTATAADALRHDEDAFLPLVNDVWPVLVKRLYDPEPFVVVAAARAVAHVCRAAGDFMASRLQTEWPAFLRLCRQAQGRMRADRRPHTSSSSSSSSSTVAAARGVYAPSYQVWEALLELVVVILEYVRVTDEMFDDALELCGEHLGRPEVRAAFEGINPGAVWLAVQMRDEHFRDYQKVPVLEGFTFRPVGVDM